MDKVIRVIQGANGVLTCDKKKVLSELDFRPNNTVGREERREREKGGENLRERSSTFSLGFPAIGPVVPGRSRRKVLPRAKSFQ